ncbi:MAG: DNA glycosylase AlkZ-like family protein [Candidatus Hodarchaeota archaeon]
MSSLTLAQVRLNHLRKQYAFEKKKPAYYEIARDQLGLHSTDYWTPYLSVWARIGDFNAEAVFRSLNSGDRLVRLNSFRRTVHVTHKDNLGLIIKATGPRLYKDVRKNPFLKKFNDTEIKRMIGKVLKVLESGPKRMRELKKELPEMADVLRWVFLLAAAEGKVMRASASHARSSLTDYALMKDWVKDFKIPDMSEEEAFVELVHLYISKFGPADIDDLAWWIPRTKTEVKRALASLESDLTQIDLEGKTKYMTYEDADKAKGLESLATPVIWFLPYEDHLPKAFINRSWYLSENVRTKIFPQLREHYWPPKGPEPPPGFKAKGSINVSGEIRPSIWMNGELIGRWEFEEKNKELIVVHEIFEKVHPKYDNMISRRAEELERFVNTRLVPISKTK